MATDYLQKMITAFSNRKAGMNSNLPAWATQPVTTLDVDGHISSLQTLDNEIEAAKDLLQQKRSTARQAVTDKQANLDQIDNLARGIHAADLTKLNEYDIKQRKDPEAAELPAKAVIKQIADDDDGIGFKITLQSQGKNVSTWEVQRGKIVPATVNTTTPSTPATPGTPGTPGTPPAPGTPGLPNTGGGSGSATVLQTPYPFLRTTKKLVFVDDEVDAGVRYFYRVRGVNSKGAGEWSEPVSAVQ